MSTPDFLIDLLPEWELECALDAALEAEGSARDEAEAAWEIAQKAGERAQACDDFAGPEWIAYRDALALCREKDQRFAERMTLRIKIVEEMNRRGRA